MRFDMFGRFAKDRRGNVAMYFGLAAVPLTIGMGMVIDYGNNTRKWAQMNAAADAAALAGVTPAMMLQSNITAQTTAQNIFNAQINGVVSNDTVTSFNVTSSTSGLQRTVTVNYTAQLKNIFGGIIGQPTMTVSGTKVATGTPANMNFYLLLDTSPSMEIVGTVDGATTMRQHTPHQLGGCAFACHESNPPVCDVSGASNYVSNIPSGVSHNFDVCDNPQGTSGTPYFSVSGGKVTSSNPKTGIDNYALARTLTDPDTGKIGLTLRIDMVATAAQAMVQAAIQTQNTDMATYGSAPTYNIAIDTFDTGIHSLFSLTNNLSGLQTSLAASPSPVQPLEVYSENTECTKWSGSTCTQRQGNDDMDTNVDAALSALNDPTQPAYHIPDPATANTNEVLLIVTDGVEDEKVSNGITAGEIDPYDSSRQQAPFAANSSVPSYQTCQALKARGIKIGILYTAYVPLDDGTAGSWYDEFIYPFQPNAPSLTGDQIGPALQNNCASPGLFMTVNPSNDTNAIANALVQLFLRAQDPHLTQ